MIVVHQNALIITFDRPLESEFAEQVKQFMATALDAMIQSDVDYRAELYTGTQLISSALDLGQFDKDVPKNAVGKCTSVLRLLNLAPTFAPLVQPSL
jgi:hypothetical protein